MNTETLFDNLHQGFRITVGATASLLETIQDSEKRSQTFSDFQSEFSQKAQEWASKGETTEQEARRITQEWLEKLRNNSTEVNNDAGSPTETEVTVSSETEVKKQIRELTQKISSLREELEELREAS
jgi:polyhydroxyalkanoate synthesis regulator phasin